MEGLWLVAFVTVWLLVLMLGVLVLSLMRNVGVLATVVQQMRASGDEPLPFTIGELPPPLVAVGIDDTPTALDLAQGRPVGLIIVSPGCTPCHDLLQAMRYGSTIIPNTPPETAYVLLSLGDAIATQELLTVTSPVAPTVYRIDPHALHTQWGIRSTPTSILFDAAGRYLRHQVGFAPPADAGASARSPNLPSAGGTVRP